MPTTHRDLVAWQLGMELAERCYRLVRSLPLTERFGLRTQITRAAASVPANIAEGYGRRTRGEFVRFLSIANGSLKELETHVELSVRCALLAPEATTSILAVADRTGKVIRGLVQSQR